MDRRICFLWAAVFLTLMSVVHSWPWGPIPSDCETSGCPPGHQCSHGRCAPKEKRSLRDCAVVQCMAGYECKHGNCFPVKSKPGSCPKPTVGICVNRCESDYDCRGALKCCFNGCGKTCTRAVHR